MTKSKISLKDQYVSVEYGDLPIIISSPHGGNRINFNDDGNVVKPTIRSPTRPKNYPLKYSIIPDSKTNYLSQKIVNQIKHLSGGLRPYQIKALFSRKIVDANRPLKYAVPDIKNKKNKDIYNTYHQELLAMIKDIKKNSS